MIGTLAKISKSGSFSGSSYNNDDPDGGGGGNQLRHVHAPGDPARHTPFTEAEFLPRFETLMRTVYPGQVSAGPSLFTTTTTVRALNSCLVLNPFTTSKQQQTRVDLPQLSASCVERIHVVYRVLYDQTVTSEYVCEG